MSGVPPMTRLAGSIETISILIHRYLAAQIATFTQQFAPAGSINAPYPVTHGRDSACCDGLLASQVGDHRLS
jgi:hypothetical protein